MQKLIQHKETLIYYDSPQLFIGYDQLNTQYICLLVECTEAFDLFLCVPTSPKRLKAFYRGEIELRKIYEAPENGELFCAEINDETQESIELNSCSIDGLREKWLPKPNFFFPKQEIE